MGSGGLIRRSRARTRRLRRSLAPHADEHVADADVGLQTDRLVTRAESCTGRLRAARTACLVEHLAGVVGGADVPEARHRGEFDLDAARHLDAQFAAWARDPAIALVALQGAGEKAFCAGGDVRAAAR